MIFVETPVRGAFCIDIERREDERGFFGRVFCEREFGANGLVGRFVQINNSLSAHAGTLRGLHYQLAPRSETKVVRCIQGALFDVVLDLRKSSPTFGKSFGVELTSENRRMMYIPKGCAHGFLTLKSNTEALYLVDEEYAPELERGIRFDDPRFAVAWPTVPSFVSEKDRRHPDFDEGWHLAEHGAGERH